MCDVLSSRIVEYVHHGKAVKVRAVLQGKHRDHCLCHQCRHLNMEDRHKNCPKAQQLYELCVEEHLVTPVFECCDFEERG
jgi:hypothetical protein